MYRYEYKFPVRYASVGDVCQQILIHPDGFREAFAQRKVHNIYFDTIQLDRLNDHLSGIAIRNKIRLRWYNDDFNRMALEIKIKDGRVGRKESYSLKINRMEELANPHTMASILANGSVPEKWIQEFLCMKPVLYNNYLRRYYEDAAGKWRMTLDEQLGFKRLRWIAGNLSIANNGLVFPLILEAKIPVAIHNEISGSLNHFPYRMGRFSKYVTGMLEHQLN